MRLVAVFTAALVIMEIWCQRPALSLASEFGTLPTENELSQNETDARFEMDRRLTDGILGYNFVKTLLKKS